MHCGGYIAAARLSACIPRGFVYFGGARHAARLCNNIVKRACCGCYHNVFFKIRRRRYGAFGRYGIAQHGFINYYNAGGYNTGADFGVVIAIIHNLFNNFVNLFGIMV